MEKMAFSPKGRIQALIDQFGFCDPLVITMLEIYGPDGGEFVLVEKQEPLAINRVDPPSESLSPRSP